MNKNIPIPSKENQDADFTAWESQFDTPSSESLPTGDAALEAARNRNETEGHNEREIAIDTPSQTVESQANRIADMSNFVPYANLSQEQAVREINELFGNNQNAIDRDEAPDQTTDSEFDSRVASSANRASEKLSAFAERYDKEGPQLLARKALRRIGRSLASPVRYTASALGEKVSSAASSAKDVLKPYVSPVEERVKLYEKQPVESDTEEIDDIEDAEEDDREFYSKKSAKALDWIGEKIDSDNTTSKFRESIGGAFFDKAIKVDNRTGTYLSRAGDKVRSGIDKMDAQSRENDGWLRDKIAEKYTEAKDRRANRVKKQRIRTVGRKLIAYHRAGRDAAKNVKRNDHQDNFDLAG